MTRIKTYLATLIREKEINIFQIDEKLTEMSTALHASLTQDFVDYGLALERFFVTTIVKPEEDANYRRFKELHFRQYADLAEAKIRQQVSVIDQQTQAQRMVIEAQGLAQKRSLEGYSYKDERGFDVAERVASNEATGQIANLGIGMGLIGGIGNAVGGAVGGIVQNTIGTALNPSPVAPQPPTPEPAKCSKCVQPLPENAKFCLECGTPVATLNGTVVCQKCGVVTPKAKFCLNCGEAQ